ncbi:hypothetical protein AAFF_G00216370 [Aldrovandia affinis]|uniref:Uncharacterized protein n=1 Tax=Aldrovandia affinis TaxID=143900 RepID=A0AAD7W492_9TELE|nr:hypothetical protein AAFF_G00216370 [Aldrovandia affinis]
MRPFPLAFDSAPAPVGMLVAPPLQPAFVPLQAYLPAPGSSMAYPGASVPVVGITPSQMVANAFCSAAGSAPPSVGGVGLTGPGQGPPPWARRSSTRASPGPPSATRRP